MPIELQGLPQPQVIEPNGMKPSKAKELAFYTSATQENLDPGEAINTFNVVADELETTGYNMQYEQAVDNFMAEQDSQNKQAMVELIEDPNIDQTQKLKALNMYNQTGFVTDNLKYKYAQDLAIMENADTEDEREAQDQVADVAIGKIRIGEQIQEQQEQADFIDNAGGEALAVLNVLASTVEWGAEYAFKTGIVLDQLFDKGSVDWNEVSASWDENMTWKDLFQYAPSNVAEDETRLSRILEKQPDEVEVAEFAEETVGKVAKWLNLEKEMEESYVNEGLEWVGDKFNKLIDVIVEKKIFGIDNREQATYLLDTAGIIIPAAAIKGYKTLKNDGQVLKVNEGTPLDTTVKSNPKAGKEVANALLEDDTNKLADAMGTTREAVVETHVLPKTKNQGEYIPDINDGTYLQQHKIQKDLDYYESVALDTMYDSNLINKEARFADIERRVKLAQSSGLYYNQASSVILPTADKLSGTMVFGQSSSYPFTTKSSILEQGKNLTELANEMKKVEIQEGIGLGLGDVKQLAKEFRKNKVMVRDLKTNETFTLTEFEKTKFNKGRYQLELEFERDYNLLNREMFGESLNDNGIAILGSKWAGKKLNQSWLSEHMIGTGFTSKWYEMARADLAPRAGVALNNFTKEFSEYVGKNPRLRKEINQVTKLQESLGTDFLTMAQLKTNFPNLSKKKLETLDKAQTAWRKSLQGLHQLTNIGEIQRLQGNGFKNGFFDLQGNYVGAVKQVSDKKKLELDELHKKEPLEIYDPELKDFRMYNPDIDRLAEMSGTMRGAVKKGEVTSDYIAVGRHKIGNLPYEVIKPIPGYAPKEYRSNFFIDVVPKNVKHNGKVLTLAKDGEVMRTRFSRTEGTASTRTQADKLRQQIIDELGDDYEVLSPRNADLSTINDYIYEYQVAQDVYRSAKSRNPNMRTLDTDTKVLRDPLTSFYDSARRITQTATASTFDKTYKNKFVKDFKKVLPVDENGAVRYPRTVDEISGEGRIGNPKELADLEKGARNLWSRHDAFQRGSQWKAGDKFVQTLMHDLADGLEAGFGAEKLGRGARAVGNVGLSGATNAAKRVASLAYITYAMPMRHWIIQPMMFWEQSIIHPSTMAKTATRAPMATIALLNHGSSVLKKDFDKVFAMLPENARKELKTDIEIMKREGILESIDQNLAVAESIRGFRGDLELQRGLLSDMNAVVNGTAKFATNKMNKYGFGAGELMNRVALWMQNKERWLADPKNKGKKYSDIENVKEISFDAWKQSGAMTSSGALKFQRQPLIGFLMQFQSIAVKSFMNSIQNTATNLSGKQRTAILANRIAMHGIEYGIPMAGGSFLMDYLMNSKDPEVVENAKALATGYQDRMFNWTLEQISGQPSNISLSYSTSLGTMNPLRDLMEAGIQLTRFTTGQRGVENPNIASVKAIGGIMERVQNVWTMFDHRPLNPETAGKALIELTKITSLGKNTTSALAFYQLGEIQNSQGVGKGFGYESITDAMFASAGFKTRDEIDQWKSEELMRSSEDRIKGAIDDLDNDLKVLVDNDLDSALDYFNLIHSSLEQGGIFTPSEMDTILDGVWAKHIRRYESDKSVNLLQYILGKSEDSKNTQAILNRLSDHPDKNVRDVVNQIMMSNKELTKEIEKNGY